MIGPDRGDSEDRDDGDGCIMIVSCQVLGCTWVHVLSVVIVFSVQLRSRSLHGQVMRILQMILHAPIVLSRSLKGQSTNRFCSVFSLIF